MEHIKHIEIQNFKSIKHCIIDGCKRINVFVGPPNVGKSNILEAMGLMSNFQNLDEFKSTIRYNDIFSLFYNIDTSKNIIVKFDDIEIESKILVKGVIEFIKQKTENKNSNSQRSFLNIISHIILNQTKKPFVAIKHKSNVKYYKFKDDVKEDEKMSVDVTLDTPNGENIFSIIFQDLKLRKFADDYLQKFSLQFSLNLNTKIITLEKKLENGAIKMSYNMIADTLRRLFFHYTAIKKNLDTILLFEEPESHCYEPYILDITNAIKYDKQNNQYFIVTHSQYIVSEFLRDEESRNNTNIYLVGLDDDGATKVKLIDREISEDVYRYGTNVFFNYDALWKENN
jgi:AAA15 family ATPase/GTPase